MICTLGSGLHPLHITMRASDTQSVGGCMRSWGVRHP